MLPFLQKRPVGGISTQVRKSDTPDEPSPNAPIEACAQDLIDAVQAGDVKKAASALRAAFEMLDSEPHVEGPHLDESE